MRGQTDAQANEEALKAIRAALGFSRNGYLTSYRYDRLVDAVRNLIVERDRRIAALDAAYLDMKAAYLRVCGETQETAVHQ